MKSCGRQQKGTDLSVNNQFVKEILDQSSAMGDLGVDTVNGQLYCDPMPLALGAFKELWPRLGPYVLSFVNLSLSSGVFPTCFKTSVVKPLLKKPGLDADSLANYRPVSNLSFLSKVFEKVVLNQLVDHLLSYDLFEPLQSAFCANEMALTVVLC